ncbi:MAG: hypothetical protein FWF82_05890, partial [Oscillospiraceae bacterium]|nr:hypothetical protein [Oscillospiraceae bacterium]
MSFVLMLFLLMPLDLYFNNYTDFNVPFSAVVTPLAYVSVGCIVLLWFVNPLISKGKFIWAETAVLLGVTLASYVQVLFFNGNMARLTGDSVDYSAINLYNIMNLLNWLSIAIIPPLILIALKKFKKDVRSFGLIVMSVSVIMVGMQVSGIIAAAVKYNEKSVEGTHFFSYNKAFELSANENIVVFIVDRLDVKFMHEALDKKPEIANQL